MPQRTEKSALGGLDRGRRLPPRRVLAIPWRGDRRYFESGNAYVAQKKYAEAVLEYRNALQVDPRFAEARYRLATGATASLTIAAIRCANTCGLRT